MTEEPRDEQDIANLLAELGNQTPDYPAERLAQRRAAYQESMAALGIGLAAGAAAEGLGAGAAKGGLLHGGLLHGGLATETILKVIIAVALLVEAVGGTVLYRRYVSQRNPVAPTVTASLAAGLSPAPLHGSPGFATAIPTLTATPTTTSTLLPFVSDTPSAGGGGGGPILGPTAQPSSTPQPSPTRTPKGLHLGQTKTPTPEGHQNGDNSH